MSTASTRQAVADGSLRLITLLIDAGADRNVTNKEGASPAQVCVCSCVRVYACARVCVCVRALVCSLLGVSRMWGEAHGIRKGGLGSSGLGFGRQTVFGIQEGQTVDLESGRGFGFVESKDQKLKTRRLSAVKPAAEPSSRTGDPRPLEYSAGVIER